MKRNISVLSLVTVFIFTAFVPAAYAGYSKPQLGTYLGELDDELREKMDYQGEGVLVHGVVRGSGAEKAGLEKNDIILEFNKQKVPSVQDLVSAVKQTTPGEIIDLKFFREGRTKNIDVEITEKKDWIEFTPPHKWIHFRSDRPYLGIRMQGLSPQLAEYFKATSGVLITEVTEDGPAHKAGLRAGDVITAWQGQEIKDIKGFCAHLDNSKEGDKIGLKIVRHGKQLDREVVLGEAKDHETYGFHINRDDTGDLVFRLGNKKYPAHFDLPVPEIGLDLKGLKASLKSLKDGIGQYHEEMKKLRDEIEELKQEIKTLKEKNDI